MSAEHVICVESTFDVHDSYRLSNSSHRKNTRPRLIRLSKCHAEQLVYFNKRKRLFGGLFSFKMSVKVHHKLIFFVTFYNIIRLGIPMNEKGKGFPQYYYYYLSNNFMCYCVFQYLFHNVNLY